MQTDLDIVRRMQGLSDFVPNDKDSEISLTLQEGADCIETLRRDLAFTREVNSLMQRALNVSRNYIVAAGMCEGQGAAYDRTIERIDAAIEANGGNKRAVTN